MDRIELSLKNIYRLLMTNDFPMYSESVINTKDRKGQTVLRFWQRQLCEEFRSQTYGKMIWRNDGTRNRYTSHLCNRSGELKYYDEYARELTAQMGEDVLLKQILCFTEFLSGKEYKYEVFLKRVEVLMQIVVKEDKYVTEQIAAYIRENLKITDDIRKSGMAGKRFHTGWLLTLLMLYAAAGESMELVFWKLNQNEHFQIKTLWEKNQVLKDAHKGSVEMLTKYAGVLQNGILPRESFFGREEELFELQEMAVTGQKVMITGIGGIGKTELLRQLLVRCIENHLVDQIAIIPYEKSLIDSFCRAFPEYKKDDPDSNFKVILSRMKKSIRHGRKILILIDNMEEEEKEETALKEIRKLSCGVFITTRKLRINGFETYKIAQTSIAASALIFRDNYGHLQSDEDKRLLYTMLKDEYLRHPLTIRMFARAARCKNWRLGQLEEHLKEKDADLTWSEGEHSIKLRHIYTQLYSLAKIPEQGRKIAELFALLPVDDYSLDFIKMFFGDLFPVTEDVKGNLKELEELGWLDKSETGYSMHPLIGQCLRKKIYHEESLEIFIHCLSKYLPSRFFDGNEIQEDRSRCAKILIHLSDYIKGEISRELLHKLMKAMSCLYVSKKTALYYQSRLEMWMDSYRNRDDLIELRYLTLRGFWNNSEGSREEECYHRQKQKMTVSKEAFVDFCLYVGGSFAIKAKSEPAKRFLQEVLESEAGADRKAQAYYQLAVSTKMSGNYEKTFECGKQAYDFAESHPECGDEMRFLCLVMLCSSNLEFGRQKEASDLLKKLKDGIQNNMPVFYKSMYEDLAGFYEMNYGSLHSAMKHFERSLEILEEYDGDGYNYFMQIGKTAIVYQRLKEYQKALDAYLYLLEKTKEQNLEYEYFLFSNNLAVVYIDMKQPGEALQHLLQVKGFAQNAGGISLAELLRNMARAYGQMQRYDKEYECLLEGSPLLTAAYGEEHPRSVAAKERLLELAETFDHKE